MNNGGGSGLLIIVAVILIYFVPSFVAFGRERNGGAIVLNLFLGWTLVGWVVALAWAASLPRKEVSPAPNDPGAPSSETVGQQTVLCPFCAEEIKPAAIVCKHCGRDLPKRT